jgi:hypothetical protein
VVRRIFDEFVAGRTPRDIARDLNEDHVAPSRGGCWNASTINGNVRRGNGILQNELNVGRIDSCRFRSSASRLPLLNGRNSA